MAVLEPHYPGAVDELAAVRLEVVDEVTAIGGAGALLEVLHHLHTGDAALLFGGQPVGRLQTHGAAAHHHDGLVGVSQLLRMGQQPCSVDMPRLGETRDGGHPLPAAVGEHHGIVLSGLQVRVGHGGVQLHRDALGLLHLCDEPVHVVVQLVLAQGRAGGVHLAAHFVGLLKDLHLVTPLGGGDSEVQTGAARADDGNLLGLLRLGGHGGQQLLEAGAGVHGALGMSALHELVDAGLLTADAGTDVLHLAGIGFLTPVGIGQHGPSQHDHVALAVPQRLFRDIGIAQLAHGHDGHLHPGVGLDAAGGEILLGHLGHIQEAAGGHASRRMGQPPVIVAAQIHVEDVHADPHQILHVVQGIGDGTAVPEVFQALDGVHALAVRLRQRKAQVDAVHDGVIRPYLFADGLDKLHAEALPVGVLAQLAAVEGGAGQLIQQIALVAVEVHAVDAHNLGVHGRLRRVADDEVTLQIRQGAAGHIGQIEVGVP